MKHVFFNNLPRFLKFHDMINLKNEYSKIVQLKNIRQRVIRYINNSHGS